MSIKKNIGLVSVFTAALVLLSGCTMFGGGENNPSDPNNSNDGDISDILLSDSGKVTERPQWSLLTPLPEGWSFVQDAAGDPNGVLPEQSDFFTVNNGTCSVVGSVEYFSPVDYGKGDVYLSQNYLYGREIPGLTISSSTVKINWENRSIELASGLISGETDNMVFDEDGNMSIDGKKSVNEYVAVRVTDLLVKNPYYVESDSNAKENLPEGVAADEAMVTLFLRYSCENPTDVNEETWNNLISSLKLVNSK